MLKATMNGLSGVIEIKKTEKKQLFDMLSFVSLSIKDKASDNISRKKIRC